LKPENILLKGAKFSEEVATRSIKIIDFGNAIKTSESATYYDHFEVQSLFYRAPEILFGLPFGPGN
jgi:serine/threonine protein kinase